MAELSNWQLAQRTVIGSLMISPDEVSGLVFQSAVPAMFGDPAMRHVFEAARDLFNDGRPIDPMTVVARAGNEYYDLVSHSMEMTPTAANVGAYLATLRDEAKLAALQTEAMTILNAKNVADAMTGYEHMGKMLGDTETDDGMSLSEMISAYIDRMNDPKPVD
jgi:replicative DNA helicase